MPDRSANPPAHPARPDVARRIFVLWLIAAAAVLAYALASRLIPALGDDRPPIGSVAVLPFDQPEPAAGGGFLGAAVAGEVIGRLTRVPELKVIGSASALRYRDTAAADSIIARELGVATLLRGTVRRRGERFHIEARLDDARTGENLWAGTYDPTGAQLLASLEDIAAAVPVALHLPGARREAGPGAPTADLVAWEEYARGLMAARGQTAMALRDAPIYFERAVARDSGFAAAWAALAVVDVVLPFYLHRPVDAGHARARAEAERALRLDGSLGTAHAVLGVVLWYAWDWDAAEREFRRALELQPAHATVHRWYGLFLAARGRLDDGEARLARALELDPLSPVARTGIALVRYFDGQVEDAIAGLDRALALDSTFTPAYALLARAYARAQRYREALNAADRAAALRGGARIQPAALRRAFLAEPSRERFYRLALAESAPDDPSDAVARAIAHAALGDTDAALGALEAAFEAKHPLVGFLAVEPGFDPLRDEPRFEALLRRAGLR